MVKKYKIGQIVDMQKKLYIRVNIKQIENPSTAIVNGDFEGDGLDVLYFQKSLFDLHVLPRIEAHHELTLRMSLLKKNRFFKQLLIKSTEADINKRKNVLTKIALMMVREKFVYNDTILTCGNDEDAMEKAAKLRRDSMVSSPSQQQQIIDNNNVLLLLFNGKLSPHVTLKHNMRDPKNGSISEFTRTVKTAILYEEADIFGLYPPEQLQQQYRHGKLDKGNTNNGMRTHQQINSSFSSLAFKVESNNANVFRIPIDKLQAVIDKAQDVKCKIMLREIKKYLNDKKKIWINFAKKEIRTQADVLGTSSVKYKETLRQRHFIEPDATGAGAVVDELEEMLDNYPKKKKKKELGVKGLLINGKIERNRRQKHSDIYKPLMNMLSKQFVASGMKNMHRKANNKGYGGLYDRSGNGN